MRNLDSDPALGFDDSLRDFWVTAVTDRLHSKYLFIDLVSLEVPHHGVQVPRRTHRSDRIFLAVVVSKAPRIATKRISVI